MRGYRELLGSAEGVDFLASRGVYVDQQRFLATLAAPRSPMEDAHRLPVFMAQQICADYRWSVVSKIAALMALPEDRVEPLILWSDVDRCGSDKQIASILWPASTGMTAINLVPTRARYAETRFTTVGAQHRQTASNRLRAAVLTAGKGNGTPKAECLSRFAPIDAILQDLAYADLRSVNHALTSVLLDSHFDHRCAEIFYSELLQRPSVQGAVDHALNELTAFITVHNDEVEALQRLDIDPALGPRAADYLPLYFTCPDDFRRLKLNHDVRGSDHFATAQCACGKAYEFWLGSKQLSVANIEPMAFISPDVSLLMYINDLFSGVVCGQSSALYGLIFNTVMKDALGMNPIPMLAPSSVFEPQAAFATFDGLTHAYFFPHIRPGSS